MQEVAPKNDASYVLSRARASVTGQTTIAASTATTPMTPPPSEKSGLAKDLIVILGLPAMLLSAGAWYYWETIFPVYRAPSEDAVFDVATGVWDWQSHEGFCKDNPHTVAFTPDRKVMVITSCRPWSDTAAADDRVAVYDISEHTASYIRGHLRDETRTTASGKDVVWDLVLTSADGYAWHRTDWVLGMQTGGIGRCPAGTDSLIAPVGEEH